MPGLAFTLLPHDKGTSLVFLLVLPGALLLAHAAATGAPRSNVVGTFLVLAGIAAATIPGNAGEEGEPWLLVAVSVAIVLAGARWPSPLTILAALAILASLLLVAVAPTDTSAFLSGDAPHPREQAFLLTGMLWLTVAAGYAAIAGPRSPARMTGVAAVYVPAAVVHGYALLAALLS